MSIARFSVRNPVLVNIITIAVIVFGVIYTLQMNREVFPSIAYGYIIVITTYPGASPEAVEKEITTPLEEEISDLDGIKKIYSRTQEGFSTIVIQAEDYVEGVKLDQLYNDIKNEADKVTDLPEDAEDPEFLKLSAEFPVITVGFGGDISEQYLSEAADRMKKKVELIDGVGSVEVWGERDREFWVLVDPRRIEGVNLTLTEIIEAIRRRNLNMPVGSLDMGREEYLIRTIGEVEGEADIEEIVVRSLPMGLVTVGDVGRISRRSWFDRSPWVSSPLATWQRS
jgi:multidrug efflux pump subunit AcrB